MKPEIIVVKLEEYIESLPRKDRKSYDEVMVFKAQHPEEDLRVISNKLRDPILNLAVIIDELKQEIKESIIKSKYGDNTLQRIKKLNKFLNSGLTDIRPQFKMAWMENGKMCATNGYLGFMLNQQLEDVPIREWKQGDFVLGNVFPQENNLVLTTLNIADVKIQIKLHKAKEAGLPKKARTRCRYIVDGHYYDAEFLIEAYEILGGHIVFSQTSNILDPAVLQSEYGKAILSPIRPPEK